MESVVFTERFLIIDYILSLKMIPDVGQMDASIAKENARLISLDKISTRQQLFIFDSLSQQLPLVDCHKKSVGHDTCRGRHL